MNVSAGRWPSLGEPIPKPHVERERSFGLLVGGVLIAIAAYSAWRGHPLRAEITAAIGAFLVVAALVKPTALRQLNAGWMWIGHGLGWFNSRVLLTLLYMLVFYPMGLLARVFGSDPLDVQRAATSLWVDYPARL